jgi:hypothetical protein
VRPSPIGGDPNQKALLDDIRNAVRQLQYPNATPARFGVTTSAKLPPAASWPNCGIILSDKNCLAISTLVGSAWTWLRADGGAI